MPTAKRSISFTCPGDAFNSQEAAIQFDTEWKSTITLAALVAAQVGSLTTRTDDNTGVATLSTGHGITTGMVVDVYWSGGVRYGMTATRSVNEITVDGGAGDVLPAQDTAVTVVEQIIVDPVEIDGDLCQVVAVVYRNASDQTAKGHVDFQDSGNATIEELDLVHETAAGGLNHITNIAGGDTNIYTGNPITHAHVSHDSLFEGKLYIRAGIIAV